MELREFAERVLFATTLEEKLLRPVDLTDENPGSAIVTPNAPGRPVELEFKITGTARDSFPGTKNLEQSRERGQLLHFFANHELLATELMALVLLKFPGAPAAFRKGLLQTLKDEQEHTQLYLARMKECGIHFGELPVSGYFWRSVSPMENPLDYVSSLCLTFEQANLDFARHYAKNFAQVGDDATSKLLEKIYRDEIGHVAYGLKWFRRWKNPGENDWEAFCRQLKFPLSPQRAKGITLNVEGRRAAGLDPQFIAALDVFSQSKGRTPNVFVFNPFAEGRIAEGKTFNPTKHQAQLARDLENLPQFLCRQDDLVLVKEKPSVEFLSDIKQAGFPLPEFVELAQTKNLATRKLGSLRPWAWSPDSVELFAPLFKNLNTEKRSVAESFNPQIAKFYSKSWSAHFLRKILADNSSHTTHHSSLPPWLCTENEIGFAVNSLAEAQTAFAKIRARGHHKIVVKESFGVAGSNALRLFEPEILDTQWRWLQKAFAQNRELVVEPWLERVADFSVQLEMTERGLKLCGFTGLINDARGQFVANFAESHFHKRIPAKIISQFGAQTNISGRLLELYHAIFARLETELRETKFSGAIGIDAFIYRDATGEVKLKPIVEINPRYTMGRVLVELMRQTHQGSHGKFELINIARLRAENCEGFQTYAEKLREKFPLQLAGEPSPRIREGVICLNDPARAQVCLATFQVTRD